MTDHALTSFGDSMARYEHLLANYLDEVWEDQLREKHRAMRTTPFAFLRATYWRWAEAILTVCPEASNAPQVLAVGDLHLENYGVWRDADGRLVWGINDFDEAAEMPYTLDLVRLTASAVLAPLPGRMTRDVVCREVLAGYRRGLENPRPFALDDRRFRLRRAFEVSDRGRARFWQHIDMLHAEERPGSRYRSALERAMPGTDARIEKFARRSAGLGSLGRPRWLAVAHWRGGRIVREAKARVPSAWDLVHRSERPGSATAEVVGGPYRSPDPWYRVLPRVIVRRLSPNSRKLALEDLVAQCLTPRMFRAMGYELANVHAGTARAQRAIIRDLDRRREDWLDRSAKAAARFVAGEFQSFRRSGSQRRPDSYNITDKGNDTEAPRHRGKAQ